MESFNVKVRNPDTNTENEVKIVEFTPTKGRGKDNPKLYPDNFKNWKLADYVNIWGEKRVMEVFVSPRAKQLFAAFTGEATAKEVIDPVTKEKTVETEDDPATIQRDFSELFSTLSLRGDTIASLNERLSEILGDDGEGNGELMDAIDKEDMVYAKTLREEVKQLRLAIESKRRERPAKAAPVTSAPAVAA